MSSISYQEIKINMNGLKFWDEENKSDVPNDFVYNVQITDGLITDITDRGDVDNQQTPIMEINNVSGEWHFFRAYEIERVSEYNKCMENLKQHAVGKNVESFIETIVDNFGQLDDLGNGKEAISCQNISEDEWKKALILRRKNISKIEFIETRSEEYERREKEKLVKAGFVEHEDDWLAAKTLVYKDKNPEEVYKDRLKNKNFLLVSLQARKEKNIK